VMVKNRIPLIKRLSPSGVCLKISFGVLKQYFEISCNTLTGFIY